MRHVALVVLALSGCQSFGAFSQPDLLPKDSIRIGVVGSDDSYHVSDEKLDRFDLGLAAGLGLSDTSELDAFASGSTLELRLKRALVTPGTFVLSGDVGAGLFTAYAAHTSVLYVPAQLVGGVHAAKDICFFLGPEAWGALSLDTPGQGAGFNRGTLGLLVGGVAGIGLEDPRFTFVPQVTVMTPVLTGAKGTVVQVNFGMATTVH